MSRLLGALGRILITAGVLILLFVGFQLWGTGLEESSHQDALGGELAARVPTVKGKVADSSDAAATAAQLQSIDPRTAATIAPPAEGQALGVIEIPKIGVQKFIVEGTAKTDLKKGPGHYMGTPLPGQAGNAAIAGHRTTYGAPFNRIDELVPGDLIETYTSQGKFTYQVIAPPREGIHSGPGWYTVKPTESSVLDNTTDNRLTLSACHPKRSAAERIIVTAVLVANPAPTTPSAEPTTVTKAGVFDKAAALEASVGGDAKALYPAILCAIGAALVWLLAWLATKKFRKVWCYLVGTPAFFVVLWFCFLYIDRWLPSF